SGQRSGHHARRRQSGQLVLQLACQSGQPAFGFRGLRFAQSGSTSVGTGVTWRPREEKDREEHAWKTRPWRGALQWTHGPQARTGRSRRQPRSGNYSRLAGATGTQPSMAEQSALPQVVLDPKLEGTLL